MVNTETKEGKATEDLHLRDLYQFELSGTDSSEIDLNTEISPDQLSPELLSAYRGMTQSAALLYGIPTLWEAPEIQYDGNRAVPDPVRRYNTPDKQRTKELATAIYHICQSFVATPQVTAQHEGSDFLMRGLLYLQILVKAVTATDFMIGIGGRAIVERGAERSERKGEL